jgi:sulfate adenylyltransferase subunit 2
VPFPLLHVDTEFKFAEMYAFRDRICSEAGVELRVYANRTALDAGANPWDLGTQRCCGHLKTQGLLGALAEGGYDALIGGARREEERSRAKERVFSFRDRHGRWDPSNQRAELWSLYNGRLHPGESMRIFPLSNWTELDIWRYIAAERIPVAPLYFAAEREVVVRGGQLIPVGVKTRIVAGEKPERLLCRFRTLGCYPCTGAVRSSAATVEEIIAELELARRSERTTRIIDFDSDGSMEQKKREGYF